MARIDKESYFILGAGKSGRAAARLLTQRGFRVEWYDDNAAAVEREVVQWSGDKDLVAPVSGEAALHAVRRSDCVVVSPGVPTSHTLVEEARQAGVSVVGELEMAYRLAPPAKIVGVTGTNGKSTVVSLVGDILKAAGRASVVAGNIGTPYADVVADETPFDVVVLEISSFQLDTIDRFKADIAVLLNVTDDHLDRYNDSFEAYVASKARILNRHDATTVFVYNIEDAACRDIAAGFDGGKIAFSSQQVLSDGAYVIDGWITRSVSGSEERLIAVDDFPPVGLHNLENALAAVAAATALGVDKRPIRRALAAYKPLPHRMEVTGVVDGVTYINDSKATNIDATIKSLASVDGPVMLILGGVDKNSDYTLLKPHLDRVKAVILIGESREKIRSALSGHVDLHEASSMAEAVRMGRRLGGSGDTVLLAPACASFDMFENYAARGDAFREAVKELGSD